MTDNKIEEEVLVPKLVIKTLTDRSITLELGSYPTIASVKDYIETKENLSPSQITLISRGIVLDDTVPTSSIPSITHPTTLTPTTTIHLFYYEPAALAYDPIESAVDWDSKNRLRSFKGLYLTSKRDFAGAAPLLIEALTTFEETSFLEYKDCVKYGVIAAMLTFDRPTLAKKVVKAPEVLEVVNEIPHLEAFIQSFYSCNYKDFFVALGKFLVIFLHLLFSGYGGNY